MKCINCTIEVPSNFKSAIKSNICPSCGKAIMSDDLQQITLDLAEAIAKMANDPEGLAGWLVSNYAMQKIGEAMPVDFYDPKRRGPRRRDEDDDEDIVRKDASKFNKFKKYDADAMKKKKEDAMNGGSSLLLSPEELDSIEDDPIIDGIEDEMSEYSSQTSALSMSDRLKADSQKQLLERKHQMAMSGSVGKISRSS